MTKRTIDTVRASRDGHEYHEAWTARKALQLLFPTDNLIGIAVEGLQSADQDSFSNETNDIADIVLYYGNDCSFDHSDKIKIVQFKYSISNSNTEFRASNAQKTIAKFAVAYNDHINKYGEKDVKEKLKFELITNRPIYLPFLEAVKNIAIGITSIGDKKINEQIVQFISTSELKGKKLINFARLCNFIDLAGNLRDTKNDLARTLVNWSPTKDAIASANLGRLRQMVRDKAGSAGAQNNIIRKVDILASLNLQDVTDLLPCPASLPEIGKVVPRTQLKDAIELIKQSIKPVLIHAAGGMGKTVFLESLSKSLAENHEVLFFDCFGGGAYRAPEDSRHLPNRGLIHIINSLAANSLCDPILPWSENEEDLIKKFRQRLSQCMKTLSLVSKNKELIIFIDAIDNSNRQATDKMQTSFPSLILKSLSYSGNIPGVKFVMSCRTHRLEESTKGVPCARFELQPFNISETEIYLKDRIANVSDTEIKVAQSRSGGNPRVLKYLVKSNRGLLDASEIDKEIKLDELIKSRIENALSEASLKGYSTDELDAFLAGLTVLPIPVPIEEYANINEIEISAVESFVADLTPLLDRTKYGLIFRDEPTESLIRENQGLNTTLLKLVANKLLNKQADSVYAAQALPELLKIIGDGEQLFKLAFDERFPSSVTSIVGKRNIRYARLKAATQFAASKNDFNSLIHLLLELSTIAAVDQRGIDYILDAPDLTVAANDVDAMRRIFETRTSWPGSRHARLTIINTLSDDLEVANRYAVNTKDWIRHFVESKTDRNHNEPTPDNIDIAAISFFLIAQNHIENALNFIRFWKDWYAFEVSEFLFSFLSQLEFKKSGTTKLISNFLNETSKEIGIIAGALTYLELSKQQQRMLVKKLSAACKSKKVEFNEDRPGENKNGLRFGLIKSIAIATSLNMNMEAAEISRLIPNRRPNIWTYKDRFAFKYIIPFLEHTVLFSAIKKNTITEKDILPDELYRISRGIKKKCSDTDFRKKLKKQLEKQAVSSKRVDKDKKYVWSYDQKQEAERFIDDRLGPTLLLVQALSNLLGASSKKVNPAFSKLMKAWELARNKNDLYLSQEFKLFFRSLGCELVLFAVSVRADLNLKSIKLFFDMLNKLEFYDTTTLIKLISILSKRNHLHSLAGELAIYTRTFIEKEDEIVSRASSYIKLARAILPASRDEASAYFKVGLEQIDAIGSGDYEFTNELLLFVSSLKGKEIDEQDFHTLSNICELNMTYDQEKFPWSAFAKGLAQVSGVRTLAKLSRWHDRSKITLDYTLLPYLTALIQLNKIDPEYALAINILADPAELYACNTATLAKAIVDKDYSNIKALIKELITQYENNNPGVQSSQILETLAEISKKILGKESETTCRLLITETHFSKIRNELNENRNYHGQFDNSFISKETSSDQKDRTKLDELIKSTNSIDEPAMEAALECLSKMQDYYSLQVEFLEQMNKKVLYADRTKYLIVISQLHTLNLNDKLAILKNCKVKWTVSSSSILPTLQTIGYTLVQNHSEELIGFNQLWDAKLKEVSELTEVSTSELAIELIKLFVLPKYNVSASIWLGIASQISSEVKEEEGLTALTRLLRSNSAKLMSSVLDGEWINGKYPGDNQTEIVAGLVWQMLGSYRAEDRWRAAHSVRLFAKLKKWEVIDALVNRYSTDNCHPFQAPEFSFYYLHARLWLLIALSRISIDNPDAITKYSEFLSKITLDNVLPHTSLRHFASETLKNCVDSDRSKLSRGMKSNLNKINMSQYPRLKKKLKQGMHDEFYHARRGDSQVIKNEFHLDYDFEKYTVKSLSDIFGVPLGEVDDMITEIVHDMDPNIKSMYEKGGRDIDRYNRHSLTSSEYHGYGHYLAYHALHIASAKLLQKYPVTDDWYYDDPWQEWLNRYRLTREDGLWLSDGIDTTPIEFNINLLEQDKDGLILTGDEKKILSLIVSRVGSEKVYNVNGDWKSPDDITVNIDSVLIKQKFVPNLVKQLIKEEPFSVWLPPDGMSKDDYQGGQAVKYITWTFRPEVEVRLDENDPLANSTSERRPQFSKDICNIFSLSANDPFKRVWKKSKDEVLAYSLAWGRNDKYDEETLSGNSLLCSEKLLKQILNKLDLNLFVLINLQRYEKGYGGKGSAFSNTVSLLNINKSLKIKYYKGAINKVHQMKY